MLSARHADVVGHGRRRAFGVAAANRIENTLMLTTGILGAALAAGVRGLGDFDDIGRKNAD